MNKLVIIALFFFSLAVRTATCSGIHGEKVITGRMQFTTAESRQPLAYSEIQYIVARRDAGSLQPPESNAGPDADEFVFDHTTDAEGIATVTMIFNLTIFVPDGEGDQLNEEFVAPRGLLRARLNGQWIDCAFPHMTQVGNIRVEWLETIEAHHTEAQPGATDNPDDAQRLREDH